MSLEKGLLRQIFEHGSAPDHARQQGKDRRLIAHDEGAKRNRIIQA